LTPRWTQQREARLQRVCPSLLARVVVCCIGYSAAQTTPHSSTVANPCSLGVHYSMHATKNSWFVGTSSHKLRHTCPVHGEERSDGPRNLLELQALHPAQPSALVLYCSDFTLTLLHTGMSLDHRNPTGAQHATSARSGFLIVYCSDCTPASFPYASASFTHSHTLSLDSYCRPTAGKSSSPAGKSTLECVRSRLRARLPLRILLVHTQVSR